MIRVLIRNSIMTIKDMEGYPVFKHIVFRHDGFKYVITLKSSQHVKDVLDQALVHGFIDFSKFEFTLECT